MKRDDMDLPLFCMRFLVILSLSTVSFTTTSAELNKDLLEDVKGLHKSRNNENLHVLDRKYDRNQESKLQPTKKETIKTVNEDKTNGQLTKQLTEEEQDTKMNAAKNETDTELEFKKPTHQKTSQQKIIHVLNQFDTDKTKSSLGNGKDENDHEGGNIQQDSFHNNTEKGRLLPKLILKLQKSDSTQVLSFSTNRNRINNQLTEESNKISESIGELRTAVSKQPQITVHLKKNDYNFSSPAGVVKTSNRNAETHTDPHQPLHMNFTGLQTTVQWQNTKKNQTKGGKVDITHKSTIVQYATLAKAMNTNGQYSTFEKDNSDNLHNKSGNDTSKTIEHGNKKVTNVRHTTARKLLKLDQNNFKTVNDLGEAESISEDPCRCTRDSSKLYTGSALVAAAVGGIFIGAFAILMLFHLKQKCRNYINGDYRRVPMDYDFELNPRYKAH